MIRNRILFSLLYMLLIACISYVIFPMNVFATDPTFSAETGDPPPPTSTSPSEEGGSCNFTTAGEYISRSCGINVNNRYKTSVYMNLYDQDGTYLGNPFSSTFKEKKFKAGMYVGIDFFEEFRVISTATINPTCQKTTVTLTCTKEIYVACPSSNSSSSSKPSIVKPPKSSVKKSRPFVERENYQSSSKKAKAAPMVSVSDDPIPGKNCDYSYTDTQTVTTGSCPEGYTAAASCERSGCTPPAVSDCRGQAESQLIIATNDENQHYIAKRHDVNDINGSNNVTVNAISVLNEGEVLPTNRNASTITRESYLRIKYNPKKACMNVKTAAIRYINLNSNCDATREIAVKEILNSEGEHVGLYFIPLNTKTTQDFKYNMTSKDKITNGLLCQNIIENYKEDGRWRYTLLDANKQKFSSNETVENGKKKVQNGCYYYTEVNFNIDQDFYNEVGRTTKKIKGYELFYRPIDINNPFPNGISDGSYWNGLIRNNIITVTNASNVTKRYDLTQSFREMTYYIENINASTIRNYNRNYFYTSWDNMNADGSSQFVNTYVTRNGTRDYYKLGCGPANSDWEECK